MNFFSMLLRNGRVLIRSYKLSFTNDLQLQILSYSAACITVAKNLPQLEIGVHRIPRTLHDAISEEDIDRTGKGPKMQWKSFYRVFIYCIRGRCWEYALALTHRQIREKSQNSPISIAISDGDIYRYHTIEVIRDIKA